MKKFERIGLISLLVLAGLFVLSFFYVSLMRINYPYELEWMEGGILQEIEQILSGGKLYVEPSLTFIPYIYGPVYFHVAAVFSYLFGENIFSMRLVSFLATIGIFVLLFLTIKKETNNHKAAFLTVGLFTATYSLSGYWFDLARVDMLFMFLLLAGIYCVRFFENKWMWILGSTLLVLSIFTKQTSMFVVGAFLLALFIKNKKKGIIAGALTGLLGAIGIIVMNVVYGKWYIYYLFELPKHHELQPRMSVNFWIGDIGILFVLFGLVVHVLWKMKKEKNEDFIHYLFLFVSMFFISWSSRVHSGGYVNVVIPAYYILALVGGYTIHYAKHHVTIRPFTIYGLLIFQFLFLMFNPMRPFKPWEHIPNTNQTKNIQTIKKEIDKTKGNIFAPSFSYLTENKQVQAMALVDIYRAKGNVEKKQILEKELQQNIKKQKYQKLILTSGDMKWIEVIVPELNHYYQRTEKRKIPESYTVDGALSHSYSIYVPKKER